MKPLKRPHLPLQDPRVQAQLSPDAPLCVALSGGADSVALLCLLSKDPSLSAVHVHHGIRGAEADRDEAFCRMLCQEHGIPLTVLHIDAPALARERGVGLETAARDGRYAAITAHMRERQIPLLVTAHHANDQLETMLQHLLRGSGTAGLGGIPACRPLGEELWVARPLLFCTHAQLEAYLAEIGQSYIEDSTNQQPCCTRNRLRLEVTPVLEELYPGGAPAAARCAASLQEDEAYFQELAADFLRREGNTPPLAALAALPRPIFARVMRRLLPEPPQRVHMDALLAFCGKATPHAALSLPGIRVAAEGGRLCITEQLPDAEAYDIVLHEGENPLPCAGLAVVLPKGSPLPQPSSSHHKYAVQISLCSAKISGELRARTLRPGDRIRACGVNRAVRRLPGSAVSVATRARMPLLADDKGVLACPFGKNHNIRDDAYSKTDCDLDVWLLFD